MLADLVQEVAVGEWLFGQELRGLYIKRLRDQHEEMQRDVLVPGHGGKRGDGSRKPRSSTT